MAEVVRPPLLQQQSFRMLCYTRFSSRVAQNALNFALVLLIVDQTGKAFLSSLLVLALVVPATVAGIAGGTAADIFPKRLLIVTGDILRAGICIGFILGPGNVASYYFVAIGLAAAAQIATSAEGATMPAIVDRLDLARGNAIGHAVGGAAQIIGFGVLTPAILRVFGNEDILFAIASGLFILAAFQAIAIGPIRKNQRQEVGGEAEGPWWLVGWNEMRRNRKVLHAAIQLTLISTALIILGGLIPKYIQDVLGLPVDIGALILMPAAIGVVLGLRVAGFLAHRVPHAALSTFGFMSFVVLLAMFTFVDVGADFLSGYGMFSWLGVIQIGNFDGGGVLAMIIVMPLGFAYATVAVAGQTVLNDNVPLHLQGRVLATQGAMAAIAASAPVLIAGALSDWIGVVPVMATLAVSIGVVAIANLRSPRVAPVYEPSVGR
jgi:MFS transporter, DHA3 family, macrolide efflux protein